MLDQKIFRFLFLIVAMLLFVGCLFIFFPQHKKNPVIQQQEKLSNCLQVKSGNAMFQVYYPNSFINTSTKNELSMKIKMSDKNNFFSVGFSYLDPLEPDWSDTTFNGYNASINHLNGSGDYKSVDFYDIPMGNRIVRFAYYNFLYFSSAQETLIKRMLDSIKITQTNEDIKTAQVESCNIK
ncbi:MAG: hypothetical protein NTY81_02510 [Candidatus Staskawiczbacteria bacterium]|nr:hypothetical protein [Candidatus Staskawiczbacteria bacterium]